MEYDLSIVDVNDVATKKVVADWAQDVGNIALSIGLRYSLVNNANPMQIEDSWVWWEGGQKLHDFLSFTIMEKYPSLDEAYQAIGQTILDRLKDIYTSYDINV